MGWRSWNVYEVGVTQAAMLAQLDALVLKRNAPPGSAVGAAPVSLLSLGYNRLGLDEGWEAVGKGVNGSFHDSHGNPIVDTSKFPDMKAMTAQVHAKGALADFYLNNCCGHNEKVPHYANDVAAIVEYGFDGTKIDGCGPAPNVTLWATLMNATGKQLLLEDCNDGGSRPDTGGINGCPFNTFRTTNDIAPQFMSAMSNLVGNEPWLSHARPTCWTQPDMLEVGHVWPGSGTAEPALSHTESKTHFSAWCVVSAPLVLGFDMSNATLYDLVWDVIANTEAIAINQAWAGDAGRWVARSPVNFTTLVYHGAGRDLQDNETFAEWHVWAKRLPGGSVAALAINLSEQPLDHTAGIGASFVKLGLAASVDKVSVRDVWAHTNNGTVAGPTWTVGSLAPHDCVFVVLTPSSGD